MRPTVYGKQIVTKGDKIVGVNIGYNFFNEHELDRNEIQYMIRALHNTVMVKPKKFTDKFKKKEINMYKQTRFGEFIVDKNVGYIRREIIIDNSELRKRYANLMLVDGKYTLVAMLDSFEFKCLKEQLGDKRKFSEDAFLYINDYNMDVRQNFGAMANGIRSTNVGVGNMSTILSGAWSRSGFLIMTNRDSAAQIIPDEIEKSLKLGALAIVNEPAGIFKDRGLGLVFLNNLY